MTLRLPLTVKELRRIYDAGGNVMAALRSAADASHNEEDMIQASYELQAGSYVAAIKSGQYADTAAASFDKFARLFDELEPFSLLETGVGEATTLLNVVSRMRRPPRHVLGVDISLARILWAVAYSMEFAIGRPRLFTGSLSHLPLPDDSVDVVYTSHSMEPNGGREEEILRELHRVTGRYLVLREPSDELGAEATRARIAQHGYVRGLRACCDRLGYRVVRHELWQHDPNPANQAALLVICKRSAFTTQHSPPALACPVSRTPLLEVEGGLYSESQGLVFPRLAGVACLLAEDGIFAPRYLEGLRAIAQAAGFAVGDKAE